MSPVILWRTSPLGPLPQRLRTLPAGLFQGKHGVWGVGQPQGFGATCGLGQLLSTSTTIVACDPWGRWHQRVWVPSLLGPALPQP